MRRPSWIAVVLFLLAILAIPAALAGTAWHPVTKDLRRVPSPDHALWEARGYVILPNQPEYDRIIHTVPREHRADVDGRPVEIDAAAKLAVSSARADAAALEQLRVAVREKAEWGWVKQALTDHSKDTKAADQKIAEAQAAIDAALGTLK